MSEQAGNAEAGAREPRPRTVTTKGHGGSSDEPEGREHSHGRIAGVASRTGNLTSADSTGEPREPAWKKAQRVADRRQIARMAEWRYPRGALTRALLELESRLAALESRIPQEPENGGLAGEGKCESTYVAHGVLYRCSQDAGHDGGHHGLVGDSWCGWSDIREGYTSTETHSSESAVPAPVPSDPDAENGAGRERERLIHSVSEAMYNRAGKCQACGGDYVREPGHLVSCPLPTLLKALRAVPSDEREPQQEPDAWLLEICPKAGGDCARSLHHSQRSALRSAEAAGEKGTARVVPLYASPSDARPERQYFTVGRPSDWPNDRDLAHELEGHADWLEKERLSPVAALAIRRAALRLLQHSGPSDARRDTQAEEGGATETPVEELQRRVRWLESREYELTQRCEAIETRLRGHPLPVSQVGSDGSALPDAQECEELAAWLDNIYAEAEAARKYDRIAAFLRAAAPRPVAPVEKEGSGGPNPSSGEKAPATGAAAPREETRAEPGVLERHRKALRQIMREYESAGNHGADAIDLIYQIAKDTLEVAAPLEARAQQETRVREPRIFLPEDPA